MRLRNIKNANQKLLETKYFVEEPTKYKGNFKKLFNNENEIHVEIGMGKGDFILGMAKKYPNINFIGIERFDTVLLKASKKIDQYELDNLKLIRFDATYIEDLFEKEIDHLYLNFSDPWPKNRHEHRRLTSDRFLKKYENIFKKDILITQKTDNQGLFEFSLMSYSKFGFEVDEISLDLYKTDLKDNVQTEYERKFSEKGDRIYKIKVSKVYKD